MNRLSKNSVRAVLALTCLVSMLGVSGCATTGTSSETGTAAGTSGQVTLEQIIADGLSDAKSDFQKEVLTKVQETGTISEADWKEANSMQAACMTEKGYPTEVIYEGTKVILKTEAAPGAGEAESEAERADTIECYDKTSAYINEAYAYINGGPNQVDPDAVQRAVLQCLIDGGLVPAETSYEEFVADLQQNEGKQYSPAEGENADATAACWRENS